MKSDGLRRVTTIAAGLVLAAALAVVVPWGARPAEAAFPGENGKIAYEETYYGIWVMDANPSTDDESRISNHGSDSGPAWSPDGQRIAFSRYQNGGEDIYVMDAADPSTDDAINISNDASSGDLYPAWSPDGQKIAFARYRDGDPDIYVMDTDPSTKDITRITKNNSWDASPDWSPGGKKIVFDGYGIITVKNSDGSGRQRLPEGSEPVWSPNGRKIAFTRLPDSNWGDHDIFVMNKDGSKVRRLTEGLDHRSPDWQPIVR